MQKKMIDNMEMAKKKKDLLHRELLERQRKLKEVADRRVEALRLSDATKKKQHNDLLTAILLHDDQDVSASIYCESCVQVLNSIANLYLYYLMRYFSYFTVNL